MNEYPFLDKPEEECLNEYTNAMSTFQLKIIAILTMAIDHIGLYFFPEVLAYRIIGRVSFPLFSWLIANGAIHTKNIKKYLIRLFMLAIISQPFFYLVNVNIGPDVQLNVVFTLFSGLLAVWILQKIKNVIYRAGIIAFIAFAATFANAEYGAMGVLSIVFFYLFFRNKIMLVISQSLTYAIGYWLIEPHVGFGGFEMYAGQYVVQLLALFSLVLIFLYNGRAGARVKYLFYVFYPLQYVVIYLLQ